MSGKIVSVVNRKGGVGKTTLTLGLADTFVERADPTHGQFEHCVVAVDLDPQASLSRALLSDGGNDENGGRLDEVLSGGATLATAMERRLRSSRASVLPFLTHSVGRTGYPFSLLANNARGWDIERKGLKKHGETKLAKALCDLLDELSKEYQYVLIDCPPGQTILAEAAIKKSDLILCPISPDYLSMWGLESFDEYMRDLFPAESSHRPPARFVFTKWLSRPPSYNPQDRLGAHAQGFCAPRNYVTLLRENGAQTPHSGPIKMPFDPKLVLRLEGSPRRGRIWPFNRSYTSNTGSELVNLRAAVEGELNRG